MEIVGYKDYMDEMRKLYPDIDDKTIGEVIRHGLSMIAYLAEKDIDVQVKSRSDGFNCFIGLPSRNISTILRRSDIRKKKKQRLFYRLRKTQYDGYRYMVLNTKEYKAYLENKTIPKAYLYKIAEEAGNIVGVHYILRVRSDIARPWVLYMKNYDATSAELIKTRNQKKNHEAKNTKHLQQRNAEGPHTADNT